MNGRRIPAADPARFLEAPTAHLTGQGNIEQVHIDFSPSQSHRTPALSHFSTDSIPKILSKRTHVTHVSSEHFVRLIDNSRAAVPCYETTAHFLIDSLCYKSFRT